VVTGAVGSGRVGTVAVIVLLPWVAFSVLRLVDRSEPARWGPGFGLGLSLSAASAFAPVIWPIVAALGSLAVGWLLWSRAWTRAAQWLVALALPIVLLLPWSWRVVTTPGLLLTEAGAIDPDTAPVHHSGWQLAFLRFGAIGQAPWWITAGLTAVALLALLRGDVWTRVAVGWLVSAAGLVAAAGLAGRVVTLPGGAGQASGWLGVPVVVAAAGLLGSAACAADGLGRAVAGVSFGWRQPVAAIAVALGVSVPLLGLGWWVTGDPQGHLHREAAVPLPAYMVDAMAGQGADVLVLDAAHQTVHYQVLAGDGQRLGDESVLSPAPTPELTRLVADLLTQGSQGVVAGLRRYGITYVVVPSPQDPTVVSRLDAVPALTRTSTVHRVLSGWQVGAAPGIPAARTPADLSRLWWVVGVGAGWVVVAVLAAPGIRRRETTTNEEVT
jgi:hypothetical protein